MAAAILDDGLQVRESTVEAVIDHDVVEFRPVGDVLRGVPQPARDHRLRIGAAGLEPLLQGVPQEE